MLDEARTPRTGAACRSTACLLELVAGRRQALEAFARAQIATEERHTAELPGDGDA